VYAAEVDGYGQATVEAMLLEEESHWPQTEIFVFIYSDTSPVTLILILQSKTSFSQWTN
jgi:hypothetical protein